mgnify:CR=1 FL=1
MEKRVAWNKGRIIGQKAPLKQQEIWVRISVNPISDSGVIRSPANRSFS